MAFIEPMHRNKHNITILLILDFVIAELNEESTDTTDATSPSSSPLFCGVMSEVGCSTSATSLSALSKSGPCAKWAVALMILWQAP